MGVQVPPFALNNEVFLRQLFFFICSLSVLLAPLEGKKIDSGTSSYVEQPKKFRVDTYDFSGEYPNLETIDINARKKKHVELDLSGEYPKLESIEYEGSFGLFNGKLTGDFPNLKTATFMMTSALMHFDLTGEWKRSCDITINGAKRDITLYLPKDIGVCVTTSTGVRGGVHAKGFTKKGWLPFTKKEYQNELAESSDIVLTIHVTSTDGHIYLK